MDRSYNDMTDEEIRALNVTIGDIVRQSGVREATEMRVSQNCRTFNEHERATAAAIAARLRGDATSQHDDAGLGERE